MKAKDSHHATTGMDRDGAIDSPDAEAQTAQSEDQNLHLEFVDEALRLVDKAEKRGIKLRIIGSIAYRLVCPGYLHLFEGMKRVLTDVDFAAEKSQNAEIREFLTSEGYEPDDGVYMASEGSRHIYLHPETKLNVDVFADELYFCHRIPFQGRLDLESPTICTTDLLLEKMQIVEINLKDFKDTLVLMLTHPLSHQESSERAIDTDYIVDMMRRDWGFYYTFTTNLIHVPDYLSEFPSISKEEGDIVRARVDELLRCIEDAPKTMGWKVRAKIGTRRIWYQEVSEKSDQF